ncbi:hypothetical protein QC760_001729 [Botrytis cinerea]|uniref:Uncharacterized protein n=1 Tax=Botryotinia fuckeliana (strain T4) TaxID=999810 RepID=G2Y755_BOTF4|nr:hypothetical protein BofuT4_uP108410.1 [Botrytis cinerea T4]
MLRSTLSRSALRSSRQSLYVARSFATTNRRQAEVTLTVDGKQVSIEGMLEWLQLG